MPTSIFVSYSHQDAALVTPVVGLLRATREVVFQDLDSIKPGRKWRGEIAEGLSAATLIVLFWCYHSARSAEVRKEYEWALTTQKDVLPVLLDATPVPAPLSEFQWVDFRQMATLEHRSRKRWRILAVLAALAVLLVARVWVLSPNQYTPPSSSTLPPSQVAPAPLFWFILLALCLVTVVALITSRVRKARRRRARATPTDFQKSMADQIRDEISRRGMGLP